MDHFETQILIAGATPDGPSRRLLERQPGARFVFARDVDEFCEAVGEAEVLFVWDLREQDLRTAWSKARRLEWIHVGGVGVDPLLFPELVESQVLLTNARGIFDRAMAEYAVALMLALAKDFGQTLRHQAARTWAPRATESLHGQRLVVVGTGTIGRAIGRLARCLGMETTGVARNARDSDEDFDVVVGREGLASVLSNADYVLVVAPLTAETHGLVNREMFAHMKPGVRFLNLGRGETVDEASLVDAIRDGKVIGAALDVYSEEPLPVSHPFWDLPNVIVSPHMSGEYLGIHEDMTLLFLENLERWIRGETPINVVDKRLGYVTGAELRP